jgi:DNA-binding transcriptional LysR family regulator
MELRQLKHLLAAIDAGSLTAAAHDVGLTQQALSKSLTRLEEDIGGRLVYRDRRGVFLTPLGRVVAAHAREVVGVTRSLRQAAARELGENPAVLRIGLSAIAATLPISEAIAAFVASDPRLRIEVSGGKEEQFLRALHHDQLDFAVSLSFSTPGELKLEQLGSERWGIAGRRGHPALSKAESLADLRDANWLIGRNPTPLMDSINAAFSNAGLEIPAQDLTSDSAIFALTVLRSTDRLAVLPGSLCRRDASLCWRDFGDRGWDTPLLLLRRPRTQLSQTAEALLTHLRQTEFTDQQRA